MIIFNETLIILIIKFNGIIYYVYFMDIHESTINNQMINETWIFLLKLMWQLSFIIRIVVFLKTLNFIYFINIFDIINRIMILLKS